MKSERLSRKCAQRERALCEKTLIMADARKAIERAHSIIQCATYMLFIHSSDDEIVDKFARGASFYEFVPVVAKAVRKHHVVSPVSVCAPM